MRKHQTQHIFLFLLSVGLLHEIFGLTPTTSKKFSRTTFGRLSAANPGFDHPDPSGNRPTIPTPIASSEVRTNVDKMSMSPAANFGAPLTPDIESFNQNAISFIKSAVFDTIFPPASSHVANPSRTYARFYALETIARMPYFAYLSVLHLYETLGWFRRADYLKLHFAESWNELHHLLIMEELGGNKEWKDRFVAQHTAVFYYWFIVVVYMFNPIWAYNLNQAVEEHAFETYDNFLRENEDHLKLIEAPQVAKDYYTGADLYLLDEMQTHLYECEEGKVRMSGDPSSPIKCDTLYDVFVAIRDDELEHANTMMLLQNQNSDIDIQVGDECTL